MESAAYQLLEHVWEHGSKDTWERINHAMRQALQLAIGSGLSFAASDFNAMSGKFRGHYWLGESLEWIYMEAIVNGNRSCIQAWEEWTGRRPFLANQVGSDYLRSPYIHRNTIERQRERLAVGLRFRGPNNRTWHVTGFDDEAHLVRLAWYPSGRREGRPEQLLKLNHAEMLAMCPAPRKAKKKADSKTIANSPQG